MFSAALGAQSPDEYSSTPPARLPKTVKLVTPHGALTLIDIEFEENPDRPCYLHAYVSNPTGIGFIDVEADVTISGVNRSNKRESFPVAVTAQYIGKDSSSHHPIGGSCPAAMPDIAPDRIQITWRTGEADPRDIAALARQRAARAACAKIHEATAEKKLSELTVSEEHAVRACQTAGLYR